jgi:hypothetical protein
MPQKTWNIDAACIELRKKPSSFPRSRPQWQILIDHQSCSPFPSLYLAIMGHLIMQSLQLPSICWEIEYPTRKWHRSAFLREREKEMAWIFFKNKLSQL